jgi:hypothetical protein
LISPARQSGRASSRVLIRAWGRPARSPNINHRFHPGASKMWRNRARAPGLGARGCAVGGCSGLVWLCAGVFRAGVSCAVVLAAWLPPEHDPPKPQNTRVTAPSGDYSPCVRGAFGSWRFALKATPAGPA